MTKELILKHDDLQTITTKFNSINEHRFFNSCVQDIYQREQVKEDKFYPVNVEGYATKSKVTVGAAFTEILELIEYLRSDRIDVPLEGSVVWCTSLIYDYEHNKETNTISVRWNRRLIPLLSGTMERGKFCLYDGRLAEVPSYRRYLLGELLQRNFWQFKKDIPSSSFVLDLPDIKKALNLIDGEYSNYKEFNRCVIKPTLKDLEKILGLKITASGNKYRVIFTAVNWSEQLNNRGKIK